jgi:hypothetical protein
MQMPAKHVCGEIKPPMQLAAAGWFNILDPARIRTRRKRRHPIEWP